MENETQQQAKTFTLDGVDYDVDNISDEAKYMVCNLNDINTKRMKAETEIGQLNAAETVFIDKLRTALNPEKVEEVKEGEVV